MITKKHLTKPMTRRQFIQGGVAVASGLFLEACTNSPPAVTPPPTEVAQFPPTNTPLPEPTSTNTPLPQPTATNTATSPSAKTNIATGEPTPTTEPTATATNTPLPDPEQLLVVEMAKPPPYFWSHLIPANVNKPSTLSMARNVFAGIGRHLVGFPRNGLPLREMSDVQKGRAVDLLQASLSVMGFEKALNIISLQKDLGNDPELYFITIFGIPDGPEPWGWRWEGHHLSRQFTIVGNRIATTPFFLGSWPTTTEAGLRAMAQEEDAALELINSFPGTERGAVIFQDRPLTSHVTQNVAQVGPLDPVGILYTDMTGSQQQLISDIIRAYIGTLPDHIAASNLARINATGLEQIRFGWAGSLERQRPQYYRVQGPTFLLEYDNTRNGGTHIHSVWRDFERDFGYHLL